MELIGATISGYRRFDDEVRIELGPRLVCVVGPNAAGKSSFLDALCHLNDESEFSVSEPTRGGGPPCVEARFALERVDKDLLHDLPEAKQVRQLILRKDGDEPLERFLEPEPARDFRDRRIVAARLLRLEKTTWPAAATEVQKERDPDAQTSVQETLELASALAGGEEEFDDEEASEVFASLAKCLRAVLDGDYLQGAPPLPKSFHRLPDDIDGLLAKEELDHPHVVALDRLRPRIPRFMKFDEGVRKLNAPYDTSTNGDPAIANLLVLAGTNWSEARGAALSEDPADRIVWRESANDELSRRFTSTWKQGYSPLAVRFELTGTTLDVLMSMQADDFIRINHQSDGVRQFLALRAFMALENEEVSPIVLIDEAETHLHYDAQADLIRVLEEQRDAAKVIYTTHSAGCLPRDLGTGVRAIVPSIVEEEVDGNVKRVQTDHSEVVNSFWTKGRGFSPMLIAMGASAFAFSSTQRALVVEGMSDVILLPTLIREAVGLERLGYQVTPSFANAHPDEIPDFDLLAARVAFLSDGDKGGREHVKKLKRKGVLDEQIIYLGGNCKSELSLEDLISKDVYLEAVNRELEIWHGGLRYPAGKLPTLGRAKSVEQWALRHKSADGEPIELRKIAIAQRILDQRTSASQLVEPNKKGVLRKLNTAATTILGKATKDLRVIGMD